MEKMKFEKIATVSLPGLDGDRMGSKNDFDGKVFIHLNELTTEEFNKYTPDLQEYIVLARENNADTLKIY